jgi:hypothetical protein
MKSISSDRSRALFEQPAGSSRAACMSAALDQWKVPGLDSAAMGGEVLDKPVFALGHLVSGHSLKHVFGALAVEREHQMLRSRQV